MKEIIAKSKIKESQKRSLVLFPVTQLNSQHFNGRLFSVL